MRYNDKLFDDVVELAERYNRLTTLEERESGVAIEFLKPFRYGLPEINFMARDTEGRILRLFGDEGPERKPIVGDIEVAWMQVGKWNYNASYINGRWFKWVLEDEEC